MCVCARVRTGTGGGGGGSRRRACSLVRHLPGPPIRMTRRLRQRSAFAASLACAARPHTARFELRPQRGEAVQLALLDAISVVEEDLLPALDAPLGVDGDVLVPPDGDNSAVTVGLVRVVGEAGQVALGVCVDHLRARAEEETVWGWTRAFRWGACAPAGDMA